MQYQEEDIAAHGVGRVLTEYEQIGKRYKAKGKRFFELFQSFFSFIL
jgi:hypothetical protein